MDLSIFKYSFYSISIAFLLCGCASYRVKPLRKLTKETAQYAQEKDNVQVCASRLDNKEFIEYVNGAHFIKKSFFVPVLITVSNNTHDRVAFAAQAIELPLLSVDETITVLGLGTFGSSWATWLASYFAMAGVSGCLFLAGGGLWGEGGALAWAGLGLGLITLPVSLVIGYCVECSNRSAFRKLLCVDLHDKILSRIDLMPGDDVSKLIIVQKKQLSMPFKLAIEHVGNGGATEFIVALPPLGQ